MSVGSQPIDIVALALCLRCKLFDQGWHQSHYVTYQLLERLAYVNAAIKDPIEQVFDRPGKFANDQRTDHAPAALECMEGAPHLAEGLLVRRIVTPTWQVLGDGFENLGGLLDEHFEQVIIDCLLTFRRWQKARRNIPSRGIDRDDRRSHDVLHGQSRLVRSRMNHGAGQHDFRHIERSHLGFAPLQLVARRIIGRLSFGSVRRIVRRGSVCLQRVQVG